MEESVALFGFGEEDGIDTADSYARRVNHALSGYKSDKTDFLSGENLVYILKDAS